MATPITRIAYEGPDELLTADREGGEADIDREHAPVTPAPCELEASTHGTRLADPRVLLPVTLVHGSDLLRHERLDGKTDDFVGIEAEQCLDRGASQHDEAICVDGDDRIGRRLQQCCQHVSSVRHPRLHRHHATGLSHRVASLAMLSEKALVPHSCPSVLQVHCQQLTPAHRLVPFRNT